MHVLFVHQNFPGQFKHIAPRLVKDFGWRCTAVAEYRNDMPEGVDRILYQTRAGATAATPILARNFETAVAGAQGVYDALRPMRDLKPDLIVAHSGFGSSLFLPYLYDAPIINFFEYFYRPMGQDLGYRPELPVDEIALLRSRTRNAMLLLDLENCDRGWTPTQYQRDILPLAFHDKIEVLFDGIPMERFYRRQAPDRLIADVGPIPADHRIVTYVTRGFEMMRGFDIFMKAAKRIYERFPNVTFIVAGKDRVHYGPEMEYIHEKSFREHVLKSDDYDLSRFRFIPNNSPELLSISDVHIYLTEPFIASWSLVEAMACGAVVVASDQTCVREYITPGENGLLCDFFDHEAIAEQAIKVLNEPGRYRLLGEAAANTVREKYSFETALPKIKTFFEEAAKHPRSPSQRAELLVRPGLWKRKGSPGDLEDDAASAPSPEASTVAASAPDAISQLQKFGAERKANEEWVRTAQSFRTASAHFQRMGPDQHPIDLTRLMTRVGEWKPQLLLVAGEVLGGMLFLLSRVATDNAMLIVAGTSGQPIPPAREPFLQAMARAQQRVICLSQAGSADQMHQQIQKAAGNKKFDMIYLDGHRPYAELRADFRHHRNRVRRGGLLAFSGIRPIVAPEPLVDGGDRLWKEIKPMYPINAEYLSGSGSTQGGIFMVKIG